jgi:hypothetical protein
MRRRIRSFLHSIRRRLLKNFADRASDLDGRYRLPQRRTGPCCRQVRIVFGIRGEDDNRRRSQRGIGAEPSDGLAARNIAQLQVDEDQMRKRRPRRNYRSDTGIHSINHEPGVLQDLPTQPQRGRLRINDERAPRGSVGRYRRRRRFGPRRICHLLRTPGRRVPARVMPRLSHLHPRSARSSCSKARIALACSQFFELVAVADLDAGRRQRDEPVLP